MMAYSLLIFLALVVTAGYTADLEMAWMFLWVIVPAWGFALGTVIALVEKIRTKAPWRSVAVIVTFSIIVHTGLMLEEMSLGAIRSGFGVYLNGLNTAEQVRSVHAADLGRGKAIFFTNAPPTEIQSVYQLNFPYEGRQELSIADIKTLAEAYLQQKGYQWVDSFKVNTYPPIYRKGSFSFKIPGMLTVEAKLTKGPQMGAATVNSIVLRLCYDQGRLTFAEQGWGFAVK